MVLSLEKHNKNMSPFDSSPQKTTETSHSTSNNSTSPSGGGDVLLKWGHRKRSRVSRTSIEDSSSSVQRKLLPAKFSSASMPPPPPLTASNGRGRKHNSPRNLEDPSTAAGTASESPSKINQIVSRSAAQKLRVQPSSGSAKCKKPSSTTKATERFINGHHVDSSSIKSKHEDRVLNAAAATNEEKVSVEVIEWPKIYIALSRKEKEDDFLAMKGTKIPQRPKKRAKNIDRTLQYCFPGMWLSDLTKSRYEVREKKSVKKQKRSRGLKGMESLESDSE